MIGKIGRDLGVLTRPVARECHPSGFGKGLLRRLGIDGNAFIDLADQAPVGGEIDEDRSACRPQFRQPGGAERFVEVPFRDLARGRRRAGVPRLPIPLVAPRRHEK